MVKTALADIAGLIVALASIPYIVNILKGKTHPNLVTWITWSVVNLMSTIATLSTGAVQSATLIGGATIGTVVITVLAFRHGVKRYTAFDIGCQVLAVIGIIAWRATSNANLAIAIAQVVILIAALPTWHHAWTDPFAETWESFAFASFAGILTFLSLSSYTFSTLASVIVLEFNSLLIAAIVLSRRRVLAPQPSAPSPPA